MYQIIQNYRTGKLELSDVPIPRCGSNNVLVKNINSLISIGTERSIIDLGRKSLLGKAKARPDLVKKFIDKAKKEGFVKTFQEALGRLDNPTALGYSSSGIVSEAGSNINKFTPGDRVACVGAGYASHADYVSVPESLCCRIPDNVSFEEASFGMLGIIALHGVRSASLHFGENVAVIGLGLLGLISVQLLKAYGCKVIAIDLDSKKAALAKELAADLVFTNVDEFKNGVDRLTGGFGADAVIITAATDSDEPVNTAVEISKFGGRVVVVGVADIHPQRNELWHKEVEIIVSKAGGAGSLDPIYENKGIDYPLGYVRWTENRNLEEFLRLVSDKKIDLNKLITHRFEIKESESVYDKLMNNKTGETYIGVLLNYPQKDSPEYRNTQKLKVLKPANKRTDKKQITIGVIGAGLFGKALLLPALKKIENVRLHTLSTSTSANSHFTATKNGFENCTTDYKNIVNNKEIDSVIVLTPHSMHAGMVIECLNNGKNIFVEKPICINEQELKEVISSYNKTISSSNNVSLLVGYNRRFSSHSIRVKEFFKNRKDPIMINYRVNPGFVPADHWVHSAEQGGSRIIGEMCHFVDLMQYITGSNPKRVYAERIAANNKTSVNSDNVAIVIKFEDGSVGNLFYSASGEKACAREDVEIFCENSIAKIIDFKESQYHRNGKKKSHKTMNQDMGYREELSYFVKTVTGNIEQHITAEEIFYSTLAVIKIDESIERGMPLDVVIQ